MAIILMNEIFINRISAINHIFYILLSHGGSLPSKIIVLLGMKLFIMFTTVSLNTAT